MSSSAERRPQGRSATAGSPLTLVVLISGRGSNLRSLIEATRNGAVAATIAAVISDKPGAPGLIHARDAGIPEIVVDRRAYPSREAFEAALGAAIDATRAELIVLAGFMRILGADFVRAYEGRMINIHPSLLPAFPGLDTHQRALAAAAPEHGASVHYVTPEVDGGPVILQARVPITPGDNPDSLAARVLAEEHRIYPLVIGWIAEGRLAMHDGMPYFDGHPLNMPLDYADIRAGIRSGAAAEP
ncbi:MAG: phosphoribosylglycinamide formyltransferase [Gammaproteobacteria bacterium]|jgi:phosphoribosylglycinamide formyltransferase-1|nr:phosphoribosylglycinamide formyltransferase [Gammaproteobacteria bacterium]